MNHPLRAFGVFLAALLSPVGRADVPAPVMPRLEQPGAGQMFYFVLTDRFANGSTANDHGGISGGREEHGFDPTAIGYFHGGDFAGMIAHLDYIQKLGVTAIWVTPPFKNKAVQSGSAAYHGYWITDFLHIDPHLGTDAEFDEFVRQAHARGMRVFMDIIVNHTADVIKYEGGNTAYRDQEHYPLRDSHGRPVNERAVAYNGIGPADSFPTLSAKTSFPYVPTVSDAERHVKNPEWLNDLTLYHNRGNSTFQGENSLYGDFVGLDDVFTENPKVVRGFIDVYSQWMKHSGVDGFRIDTAKHVNKEFWQAFSPAIHAQARKLGKPEFFFFGEVADDAGDVPFLSEFTTEAGLDGTLDFGFFNAARAFVSQGKPAAVLADFFERDDYYTDHDSNAYSSPTFLGNHDAGRFGYFLRTDNAGATDADLLPLVQLGHALLFLSRGQPVVYYGDEQGMAGTGNDMQAREDMFASQTEKFRKLSLIGTKRAGPDDKFDPSHPLYRTIHALAALRAAHPALNQGAMLLRRCDAPSIAAFSRIDRSEKVEYVVALNNSRTQTVDTAIPTSQPPGATLQLIFDSGAESVSGGDVHVDAHGNLPVKLPPLHYAVWRAKSPLSAERSAPSITWKTPASGAVLKIDAVNRDGQTFAGRHELRCDVAGSDGYAEVTFALRRASRPDETLYLGTDDNPPYRVFWTPPADLTPGEPFTLLATVDDLRGHRSTAELANVQVVSEGASFGIRGSTVPHLTKLPPPSVTANSGAKLKLEVSATGTEELTYQWFHDGQAVAKATGPTLTIAAASAQDAGSYTVAVHNVAGTTLSRETRVTLASSGKP